MLKFAVFDNQGPARTWTLRHAHVLGPDDLAIPSEIVFEDGVVTASKRVAGAAALSVQFEVGAPTGGAGAGSAGSAGAGGGGGGASLLTLRTCLLPARAEPYLLSLELARRQVMMLLNKLEEWALFERGPEEPAMAGVAAALEAFTHALVVRGGEAASGAYSLEADRAARAALSHAVAAGDALAALHARTLHQRRLAGELAKYASAPLPDGALTDHEARASRAALLGSPGVLIEQTPRVGVAVNPNLFSPELQNAVQANCDFITLPMRWVDMEPTEGKYAFTRTDRWIEWAIKTARLPVVAGPLLDLHPRSVPEWIYIWEHDYETLRDMIFEHVKTLLTRYRRTVAAWTVCSGLHATGSISLSPEQCMDLTKMCVAMVRKLAPTAKVQVEVAQPWGEYTGTNKGSKAVPPLVYADLINQLQINPDLLGIRMQMGQAEPGRSSRDLLAISALLDRFAAMDRPIAITAFGAPSAPPGPAPDGEIDREPGYWRAPWSAETQARWLTAVGSICAGKPYVATVCWSDLYDASPEMGGEMPAGGVMTAMPTPISKPALRALGELRVALRERKPLPAF